MNNIFVWYLITFYESIIIPISIFYFIFYLVLQTFIPILLLETTISAFTMISFPLIMELIESIFFLSIGFLLFSVIIIQPLSPVPPNILRSNSKYERILFLISTICFVFLLIEHKQLKEQFYSIEKMTLIQKELLRDYEGIRKNQSTVTIKEERVAAVIQQLQQQIQQLQSEIEESKRNVQWLEVKVEEEKGRVNHALKQVSEHQEEDHHHIQQSLVENSNKIQDLFDLIGVSKEQYRAVEEKLENHSHSSPPEHVELPITVESFGQNEDNQEIVLDTPTDLIDKNQNQVESFIESEDNHQDQ